ncbi:hypothetical protein [Brasilonema sp. UFV-L1]|uniref:hypothetical protein n=1 Tax=Brasilonema sp. UFV-L1 TaxID=2234130 RepID=UPI00145C9E23|nr:hypothetical protein [Brasilonema sp. UFV-L1]NMG08995.1 hypothetical protein [Brasilonema sp. UFV-L1]
MKQMMTISGGILFAVAMISLIFGGATFVRIIQFQNELKSRGQANKIFSEVTGLEKFNEQELKGKQDVMFASLATAGIFGSAGIGLAIAGRNKAIQG